MNAPENLSGYGLEATGAPVRCRPAPNRWR